MEKELKFAIWIGAAALVAWLVSSRTAQAAPVQAPQKTWKHARAKGDVWAKPLVSAPNASIAPQSVVL